MSCATAQKTSHAVEQFAARSHWMAKLGATGTRPEHVERDFHRKVHKKLLLQVKPELVNLPVRNRRTGQMDVLRWPLLLPHQLLPAIISAGQLQRLVSPDGPSPADYWGAVQNEVWAAHHPVFQMHAGRDTVIPCRLHGDGAAGHRKREITLVQWSSALCHGCSWDYKFIITLLPSKLFTPATWDVIWERIAESFQLCMNLPGWKAAFVGLKGDQLFLKAVLRPNRNFGRNHCCWYCFASSKDPILLYTDMREDAGWLCTLEDNMPENQRRHALWSIPGMHLQLVLPDLVHCMLLGSAQDFCGAVLVECQALVPLQAALLQFRAWCKDRKLRTSLDELKPDQVKDSQTLYATLPGKASDAKMFVSFLATVLPTWLHGRTDDLSLLMQQSAWALSAFLCLLDEASWVLTDAQCDRAVKYGNLFVHGYIALARDAHMRNSLTFKLRQKLHLFHHIVLKLDRHRFPNLFSRQNPRTAQTFQDEDFIGKVMRGARRVHPRTVARRTIDRWLSLLSARWFAS